MHTCLCTHAYICIHIQHKHKYTYSYTDTQKLTHIDSYTCTKSHVNTSIHMHTWSVIQVEFISLCGVRSRLRCFCLFAFAYDCQFVLGSLFEKSVLFPSIASVPLSKSQLFSVPLICVSILSQIPHCLAHSRFIMHF